jgi:hypothetical protein
MSRFAEFIRKFSTSYYAHSVLLALIPAVLFLLFSGLFASGSLWRSMLALLFAAINVALFPYARIVYQRIAARMRMVFRDASDGLGDGLHDDDAGAERFITLFVKALCKSVFLFAFWLLAIPFAPVGWWLVRR